MGNPFSFCWSHCFPTRAALKSQQKSLQHFETGVDLMRKEIDKQQKELDLLVNQKSLIATKIMAQGNKALSDSNLKFNLRQLFDRINLKQQLIRDHQQKIQMLSSNQTLIQSDYTNTVFLEHHGAAIKHAKDATRTLKRRTNDLGNQVKSAFEIGNALQAFGSAVNAGADMLRTESTVDDQAEEPLNDPMAEEVNAFITSCLCPSAPSEMNIRVDPPSLPPSAQLNEDELLELS